MQVDCSCNFSHLSQQKVKKCIFKIAQNPKEKHKKTIWATRKIHRFQHRFPLTQVGLCWAMLT